MHLSLAFEFFLQSWQVKGFWKIYEIACDWFRIDVLSKTFAKGNLGFCERERFRHGGLQTQWDIWSCLTCFTNWALIDTSWEL
jgi:hypothetical protein